MREIPEHLKRWAAAHPDKALAIMEGAIDRAIDEELDASHIVRVGMKPTGEVIYQRSNARRH